MASRPAMTTEFEGIVSRFAASLGEAVSTAPLDRYDRRALLLTAYKETKVELTEQLVAVSGYPEKAHAEPLRIIMRFVPLNGVFHSYHKEGTLAGFRAVVNAVRTEVEASMATELEEYVRFLAETPSEYLMAVAGIES